MNYKDVSQLIPTSPDRLYLHRPWRTTRPPVETRDERREIGEKHTSFCARCCISSARSCSTIICSSLYASAHGTPSSSALVLTTHSVLPPNSRLLLIHDPVVDTLDEMERRADAGIMSCSAARRS